MQLGPNHQDFSKLWFQNVHSQRIRTVWSCSSPQRCEIREHYKCKSSFGKMLCLEFPLLVENWFLLKIWQIILLEHKLKTCTKFKRNQMTVNWYLRMREFTVNLNAEKAQTKQKPANKQTNKNAEIHDSCKLHLGLYRYSQRNVNF